MGNCCHHQALASEFTLPPQDSHEAEISSLPLAPELPRFPVTAVLTLHVLQSDILEIGSCVRITPSGCVHSKRRDKDGVTYFGYSKAESLDSGEEIVNDVSLKSCDAEDAQVGRHFEIAYQAAHGAYTIRDLGLGFGAFLRIQTAFPLLSPSTLVNIGHSYLIISPSETHISVKIHDTAYRELSFPANETDIKIGRFGDYEVVLEDEVASRSHAYVKYTHKQWYLCDGEPALGQKSTNGTWVYLGESCVLSPGMVFRAGQTIFEVTFDVC